MAGRRDDFARGAKVTRITSTYGALYRDTRAPEFYGPERKPGPFGEPRPRDPFFSPGDSPHREGVAYFDAFRLREMALRGELGKSGYKPGDSIRVTWVDRDKRMRETTLTLPHNWRSHAAWSDFYARLREFYYPLWASDAGVDYDEPDDVGYHDVEGGYVGLATAG